MAAGEGALRVLVPLSSGGMGGGERVALDLAARVRDRDVEAIVTAPPGGWVEHRAAQLGVTFVAWRSGGPFDLIAAWRLRRVIEVTGAGVLHAHLNAAAFQAGFLGPLAGIPVVAHVHGMNRARYYRGAARLLAVSRAAGDHLVRQDPSLAPRISVLPNHVDPHIRADAGAGCEWRRSLGIGPDRTLLAVIGKLHSNKGQRVAVEAMTMLPPTFTLVLVGDGPDRGAIEGLVRALGLDERVILAGSLEDPSRVYGAADLVLVPSGQESFSLVAAEALTSGVRVLAHDTGGIPEVVSDPRGRVAGLDPAEWSRRIRARLEESPPPPDPSFSPRESTLDRLVAVYRELARATTAG